MNIHYSHLIPLPLSFIFDFSYVFAFEFLCARCSCRMLRVFCLPMFCSQLPLTCSCDEHVVSTNTYSWLLDLDVQFVRSVDNEQINDFLPRCTAQFVVFLFLLLFIYQQISMSIRIRKAIILLVTLKI